jgi:hypothetical protein
VDVAAIVRQAKNAVCRALGKDTSSAQHADILDTLKQEHDEIRGLLSRLQNAESAPERQALVRWITLALMPHMRAEEGIVYAAVLALSNRSAQANAHEGCLEHEWAAKTLRRLESIEDAMSPEHRAAAKVLQELVAHNIREEENSLWSDVRQRFDEEMRMRMNTDFLAAKLRVPVH